MKPRTTSDWTIGAKLNDEHVSEQEAERIAEVNALREEVEKLRKQIKPPKNLPMTDDDKGLIIVLAGIATVMLGILIWMGSLL